MAGGSGKVTKKSNMKPFFNMLVVCKKDCVNQKSERRKLWLCLSTPVPGTKTKEIPET